MMVHSVFEIIKNSIRAVLEHEEAFRYIKPPSWVFEDDMWMSSDWHRDDDFDNASFSGLGNEDLEDSAPRSEEAKIEVIFSTSPHEVNIKIHDRGGGIRLDNQEHMWTYGWTTAQVDSRYTDEIFRDMYVTDRETLEKKGLEAGPQAAIGPLAGFGYGLPVARTYARYFGGDVQVNPMDGYGTDVFMKFKRASGRRTLL
jgi:hypothetical protein